MPSQVESSIQKQASRTKPPESNVDDTSDYNIMLQLKGQEWMDTFYRPTQSDRERDREYLDHRPIDNQYNYPEVHRTPNEDMLERWSASGDIWG